VLAELPVPEPKAGEVRIRVAAAGVNFPDALIVQKKYQLQPPLPFVPGTEVAGSINEGGEGVGHLKTGDRVIAFVGIGGFAEFVCTPAALVAPVPPGVADDVAAAFTLTYPVRIAVRSRTARERNPARAVQAERRTRSSRAWQDRRARVIAAASSTKAAAAREHGADDVINYSTTDLREAMKGLTAGKGADVIYDPVGGPLTEAALRSLGWRGRLLVVGFAQGEIPQIAANLLLLKGASAVGVFWGEFAKREPGRNRAMLTELFTWLGERKLRPHVSRAYPLAEAPQALAALLARKAVGKLVLKP
jgi:NADPH2:quinone reductase